MSKKRICSRLSIKKRMEKMSDFFNEEVDVYNQAYQNVEVKGAIFRNKTLGNITVSSSSFFDCTFDTVVFNHVVFTKVDL